MGMVVMSKRELNLDVLARLDSDRLTVRAAAELMAITPRQTYRLLRRYRDGGASAIANQRRGRPSNNRLPDVVRDHAIALVRERYTDFGPTFAAEKLAERHDLKVSRETLRSWMRQAGIWISRTERKRVQQPRHRREHIGELIQIDGSEHRWFENRAAACTLLVFVDDATSRLMELHFVPSESTFAYFEALKAYLCRHGKPVAFYSDKHSIFGVEPERGQRQWNDPVRAGLVRTQHRDSVPQYQPGEGARRARTLYAAGSSGEGSRVSARSRRLTRFCQASSPTTTVALPNPSRNATDAAPP
jgi:transposase